MIEAVEVDKTFRKKQALSNVSMTVPNGQVTAFVGPNGSGKTTMMKIAADLIPATNGYCAIDGKLFQDSDAPQHTLGTCMLPDVGRTRH
ncbi:MAG: ATP-binding cassette domain-containing protein [Propionibacteriaceae bacterium]|jgi:ABC-type multidrug transport system ATPase subunit|nr:ATP-binding cassette domain-containing protein [Propionibacteriaceae bacterium]